MRPWSTFVPSRYWLVPPLVALAAEVLTRAFPNAFLPPPTVVLTAIHDQWFGRPGAAVLLSGPVCEHVLPSLSRTLGGWALAAVAGVVAGLTIGLRPGLHRYTAPALAFLRALPPPILLPVFLLVLGLGTPAELATIVSGAVWPVLLAAVDGARSVHPTQVATAEVFGLSRSRWIGSVVFPAAWPAILAGLRVSMAMALVLMVVSELAGASSGIGYQLAVARDRFDYPGMWAVVVLLATLGCLLDAALRGAASRVQCHRAAPGSGTSP